MKKSVLAISIASLLMFSCNKKENTAASQEDTTQNQVENQEEVTPSETQSEENNIPYLYKAENGDIVEAHFLTDLDPKQVHIKLNEKELTLNQTEAWAKGAEYGDDATHFTYKQEKATLKVDGTTMKLELISPLTYNYTADNNSISVTYFSKNNTDDKRYATLRRDQQDDITLEQTEAWAKGATYGNGEVTWTDKNGTAVLTENGVETTYKRAE